MKFPKFEASLWSGMSFGGWSKLLLRNAFAVSPSRLPLAAMLTPLTLLNSCLRLLQAAWYGARASRVEVADPIFIIGHWRTGTTALHELMGLDPRNRCPTTFECLSPCHFLLTEQLVTRWLWFALPRRRPMDNVRVGFDRPQEDESAMCNLGQPSAFLSVAFPNRPLQYPAYVDFDSLSEKQRCRWFAAHRRFLQYVLFKRPGRLVLKSPQHTFRLRHLLKAYPRARFIHMSRHPYEVFPSTVHFWNQMFQAYGLQRPHFQGLEEFVLSSFSHMQDQLDAMRPELAGRLVELRYEDLVEDMPEQVRRIYQELQLEGFEEIRPAIEQYARKRYQRNEFSHLPAETRRQLHQRWGDYFSRYGYEMAEAELAAPHT